MTDVASLIARIDRLEAESAVRQTQMRYMALCDTPCPEYSVKSDAQRIDLIMELFAQDAIWEGVGEYYDGQFGAAVGKPAIRDHFEKFWGQKKDPALVLNCHYVTSEQIQVSEDAQSATGQWVHMQPWLYSDGTALLRSSRLNNAYRKEDNGNWLFTRNRTENVLIAPLPNGFATDFPSASVVMRP